MTQPHHHKIQYNYNTSQEQEIEIDKIQDKTYSTFDFNFRKNQYEYDTDWLINSTRAFSIELKGFPEWYLYNLKVLALFKTSDNAVDEPYYQNAFPSVTYNIEQYENREGIEDKFVISGVAGIPTLSSIPIWIKIKVTSINPNDDYELQKPKT